MNPQTTNSFRRHWIVAIIAIAALDIFSLNGVAQIKGPVSFNNLDLGFKYIKTGPVGYFDVYNNGDTDVTIDSVTIPDADKGTFSLLFHADSNIIKPHKFLPIGVKIDLEDTLRHTTIITVKSNAINPIIADTLYVVGRDVGIHTFMEDRSAHAFEYLSMPVVVTSFTDDIHEATIQRWSCNVLYNDTLLTMDTTALTSAAGRDTQGVSKGYEFHIDSPFVAGNVHIHANGITPNGIHAVGDTIFKITFEAMQYLQAPGATVSSAVRTIFTPDTGFLYARYSSDDATFTILPCSYPTKVTQATTARFVDNHPNPFNPSTRVRFQMDQTSYVNVAVYDRIGRLVKTLVDGIVAEGIHEISYDANDEPSGMYFCRLTTPICTDSRLITLSR